VTVGLDLGDRMSRIYEVDVHGGRLAEATIATSREGVGRYFSGRERCRVVLEAGTHSHWVSRQLEEMGLDVVVANPSKIYTRSRRTKRNDRTDAEFLARQGRADVQLLAPIRH